MKRSFLLLLILMSQQTPANPFDPNTLLAPLMCIKEESDICKDPFSFICAEESPVVAGIQEKLEQQVLRSLKLDISQDKSLSKAKIKDPFEFLSEKIQQDDAPKSKDDGLRVYAKILKQTYRSAHALLAEQGFTKDKIQLHLQKIQNRILNLKDPGVRYTQELELLSGGRPDFRQKIASIKIVDIERMVKRFEIISKKTSPEEYQKSKAQLEEMFLICGADGLSENATYSVLNSEFIICPGFLLEAAENKSLFGLDFTIGLEISHSVDPMNIEMVKSDPPKFAVTYLENYRDYLKCVDGNFGEKLRPLKSVIDRVPSEGRKNLQAHLEELLKSPEKNRDAIFATKRSIERIEAQLQEFRESDSQLKSIFGKDYTAAQSHSAELVADFFSARGLAEELKTTKEDKGEILKRSLQVLCSSETTIPILKFGKNPDDGTHPSSPLRAELIMKNPEIRKALNCRPLTALDKPWCELTSSVNNK